MHTVKSGKTAEKEGITPPTLPEYFDVNVRVGPAQRRNMDIPWSTPDLAAELAQCGVRAALCRAPLGAVDDPLIANQAIAEEVKTRPHFLPVATITPSLLGQIPGEHEQLDRLQALGMRAVIAWPSAHKVGIHCDIWEKWAETLAPTRIPLLVEIGELPGVDRIGAVIDWLRLFDAVPVILLNASWGQTNYVLRLMERCPSLHMEMSNWQAHNCPEFLVRHFGTQRILFGSGLPEKTPGAGRAAVDYADLSSADKAAIASGNLLRLLGLDALPSGPIEPPSDPITSAARSGMPPPCFVADAHAHVMAVGQRLVLGNVFPDSDPEQQKAVSDRIGIRIQCQASWTGPVSAAARIGNDILLDAWRRFPEHIAPMATVDPTQMTPAEIETELRRMYIDGPAVGLKPYHMFGIPYHAEAWEPFFRFGNDHRLFALLHPLGNLAWTPGSPQAQGYVDLACRFPDLSILIAHCGSSYPYARTALWIARQQPNVFLELTYTTVTAGIVEYLVEEIGSERILFGTDAPMRDPRQQFGWIAHARIDEADKRRILGENFCRILSRIRLDNGNPVIALARRALRAAEDAPPSAPGSR